MVSLAKKKIISDGKESDFDLSSEPYPLVMDAPFSNATRHIPQTFPGSSRDSRAGIMFVMQKDWNYAEPVMSGRVGMRYRLDKVSETYTRLK